MEQMKLQITNNQILNVFGQYDINIKKIERSFAVNIVNRGEDIIVSGSKYSLGKAEKVLKRLKQNQDINYEQAVEQIEKEGERKSGGRTPGETRKRES